MISELNRRIEVVKYSFSQDSAGGNIKTPAAVYSMWAGVEQTNGSRALDNMQIIYSRAFKITLRGETSRPFLTTNEIFYNENKLTIAGITNEKEGKVNFLVLDTYTTDEQTAALPFYKVYYGWNNEQINPLNFLYQKSIAFLLGDPFTLDFSGVPGSKYIALRYSKNEGQVTKWIDSAAFNFGVFPDQVFYAITSDAKYYYLNTRLPLALTGPGKKISFSV